MQHVLLAGVRCDSRLERTASTHVSSGLDCMHYRFVDSVTDPPDTKQWHSEELWYLYTPLYIPLMMLLEAGKLPRHFLTLSTFFITFLYHSCVLISRFVGHNSHARASHTIHRRLPECFLSFAPPEDMLETEVVPSPCLQNGHVSFGNFNNFSKTRFVSKRPKINSQKRWSCLVLVLARAMVKSARPVLSRWPTVPDCVQGAEPDVVPCHRCNHPCRNAVVCLFAQNMFFENKKSWKSSKNKNSC